MKHGRIGRCIERNSLCRPLLVMCLVFGASGQGFSLAVTVPDQAADAPETKSFAELNEQYKSTIQSLVRKYCLDCHSTMASEGELDLEQFTSVTEVRGDAAKWQKVEEMLENGEMPSREAPQPSVTQRAQLLAWVQNLLQAAAFANAGDPGPVLLRRLSNAEYKYTIQDLTQVSLDPTDEFPQDGAAGEGFTNTGYSSGMSPALMARYLDAAREVASHAVLLPEGIRFSEWQTRNDRVNDTLHRIRSFYGRFTDSQGGDRVNLQGVIFDTNAGGRLRLEEYLKATLAERDALLSGTRTIADVAAEYGLSSRYLSLLWSQLTTDSDSQLLNQLQERWRLTKTAAVDALKGYISEWQQALWQFTTVGHIGKVNGPSAWMEPNSPLMVEQLAEQHGVEASNLAAWLNVLGSGVSDAVDPGTKISRRSESASGYDFIRGWTGDDALSVIANSSDQHVRIPGNMKPHSIAVHPAPQVSVGIGWKGPVNGAGAMQIEGSIQHAHPECGNGVEWVLELRRGIIHQRLASGTCHGSASAGIGPLKQTTIRKGDVLALVVSPRDGNHSCDLTAIELTLTDGTRRWNLAAWCSAETIEQQQQLGLQLRRLLQTGVAELPVDAPNVVLYRQLTSLSGPLLADSLCIRAPQVIEIRLPRDLVAGADFVTTARLHRETGNEGSVQVELLNSEPTILEGLKPTSVASSTGPGPWTSVTSQTEYMTPVIVAEQSDARRRMLQDSRVRRLSTEFFCQWLQIYDFDQMAEKSERHFPTFSSVREPLYEKAIRYFTDFFQRDGAISDLFHSDHIFVNQKLAEHYGIPDITGNEWRRLDGASQYGRGGVLTLGAVLARQSGASRTSPILRGNWLSEVVLGEKSPKPPKGVPPLPEDGSSEELTMRQLVERHTSDVRCSGCHRRIDPYGFALEAYDAAGRRRTADSNGQLPDTTTSVLDGTNINGIDDLRRYVSNQRRNAVLRQFCRKLLGYALGRAVQLSDEPLLIEIRKKMQPNQFRVSVAVESIVASRQFREIRGRDRPQENFFGNP